MNYPSLPPGRFGAASENCPRNIRRTRGKFAIFKLNPFDPRLRSHKIQKLSVRYAKTIHAAEIEADLRVVF
ncbi:MAG: hypothetical protein M3429_07860 [Verrucomicrobiota bacterium]|nr:hypothetical protein [Verrucomicrobiota bacterium]